MKKLYFIGLFISSTVSAADLGAEWENVIQNRFGNNLLPEARTPDRPTYSKNVHQNLVTAIWGNDSKAAHQAIDNGAVANQLIPGRDTTLLNELTSQKYAGQTLDIPLIYKMLQKGAQPTPLDLKNALWNSDKESLELFAMLLKAKPRLIYDKTLLQHIKSVQEILSLAGKGKIAHWETDLPQSTVNIIYTNASFYLVDPSASVLQQLSQKVELYNAYKSAYHLPLGTRFTNSVK